MVDDGEWAGVPIGGLGTGSIGRTFRGDVARWHLEVGQHRFEPVAADGFSLYVGPARGPAATSAGEQAVRPRDRAVRVAPERPAGLGLGPARRWRHVPRVVPAGLADVRARGSGPPGAPHRRAAVAGHRRRPRAERAARRGLRVVGGESRARPADGRAPVHLGRPAGRAGRWSRAGTAARGRRDAGRPRRDARTTPDPDAPTALRGTLAIAALAADGWTLTARADFDPLADTELWADFAADGRLDDGRGRRRPCRRHGRTGGCRRRRDDDAGAR